MIMGTFVASALATSLAIRGVKLLWVPVKGLYTHLRIMVVYSGRVH